VPTTFSTCLRSYCSLMDAGPPSNEVRNEINQPVESHTPEIVYNMRENASPIAPSTPQPSTPIFPFHPSLPPPYGNALPI
jgi:hypothetical protein